MRREDRGPHHHPLRTTERALPPCSGRASAGRAAGSAEGVPGPALEQHEQSSDDGARRREDAERARKEAERPLRSYSALTALFGGLCGMFAVWMRRSERALPPRMEAGDLALITVATHKLSRLITKDRVTSAIRHPFTRYEGDSGHGEVSEAARGTGLRRAIGELLICPYCIGMWIAAAFTAGLAVAPRPTRWIASALTALFGSDLLQIAYKRAEQTL